METVTRSSLTALSAGLALGVAPAAGQTEPPPSTDPPSVRDEAAGDVDGNEVDADALPADVVALAEPAADGTLPPISVALTLSGGASLGAYEAGWLYVIMETAKRSPEILRVRLVTGTSAGSINGLLAVLSGCQGPEDRPTESPFWTTWMPIGVDELYRPDEDTPLSAFSSVALREVAADIGGRWEAGLHEACDVVFGVATTRVHPRNVSLPGELISVPRTEEKFVVRVRGRGPWRPPAVTNYVPENPGLPVPLLPLDGVDDTFPALEDLLLASAAYPIAFAPVDLDHCLYDGEGAPTCSPDVADSAPFIDGGLLDNRPLRLGVSTMIGGLAPDPNASDGWSWRETRGPPTGPVPDPALFLVLDPWAKVYPDLPEARPGDGELTLLSLVASAFEGFVYASRAKEIQSILEAHPSVRERLVPSRTRFPPASDPLGGFLGFFERSFRELDFFLGMDDAYAQLARARVRLAAAGYDVEDLAEPVVPEDGTGGWERFRCVRAALDGVGDVCAGGHLRDLRILLQVTLERLYERCADAAERTPKVSPRGAHPRCEDAQAGGEPPRVAALPRGAKNDSRRRPGETDLDHCRRLAAYRFRFRDLGLSRGRAEHAPVVLRQRLEAILGDLAEAQGLEGRGIETVGRVLLDELVYLPRASIGHLVGGPAVELGWSGTDPGGPVPWLRGTVALQVDGLLSIVSSRSRTLGFAPLAGVEIELLPLSHSLSWHSR